jgi:hypothetical protein
MRLLLLIAVGIVLLSTARAAAPRLRLSDGRPVLAVYYATSPACARWGSR